MTLWTEFALGLREHVAKMNEPSDFDDDLDARSLIEAIRGGIPDECDFCGTKTAPEKLHPEEAGMWACEKCLDFWEKNDA